ncbi:MAG: hypothetical protein AAGE52_12000 [Myxococcota bacterium]
MRTTLAACNSCESHRCNECSWARGYTDEIEESLFEFCIGGLWF